MEVDNLKKFEIECISLIDEICNDFNIYAMEKASILINFSNFILMFRLALERTIKENKSSINEEIINKIYNLSNPPIIKEIFYDVKKLKELPKNEIIKFVGERKEKNPHLSNRNLGKYFCFDKKTIKSYLDIYNKKNAK